jgi:large subunit ribosomal protein L4
MAEIEVKNLANEVVGKLELSDEVFKAPLNMPLIWEAVKHYEDSLRAGTAATKTRSAVSGSGKKLWRQKGTGRARIGSIRSPLWRHGGTVHGPQPRSYVYAFPRKKIRGALRSALSARFSESCLTVVDAFGLQSHKTKDLRKMLDGFGAGRKVLLIDAGSDHNLRLSSRNLPKVKLVPGQGVNIHDVVNHELLIFSKEAILQVQEVLSR